MALFDKPLDELWSYRPERNEPADFDAFWHETIVESRSHPLDLQLDPIDTGLRAQEVFDVTFSGYAGQRIKGWLLLPRDRQGPVPCIIHYVGYGGGRGLPYEWLGWPSMGFAAFVMDTRGQGSAWSQGDTPDSEPADSNPQYPGFMTRGVLAPHTYYYRRVFTDALRAIEAAQSIDAIDSSALVAAGGSQGGGIALAAAGLSAMTMEKGVALCLPDVPFMSHFRRATEITDAFPYQEIVRYCKVHRHHVDQVFETLDYFDVMNFAARAKASALFSVGMMDDICPPSTVFAAYNHYAGKKDIRVWRFNQHEGGQVQQFAEQVKYVRALNWVK